jgi:transmembrane sensor
VKRRTVNASAIEDDAAAWAARLDGQPDLEPSLERDLQAWLDADPHHVGALLRAQSALSFLERSRALDVSVWNEAAPPRQPARAGRIPRRLLLGAGSAAAAASLGGFLFWSARGPHYATSIGEVRRVPLADGSLMTINTASSIRVDLHRDVRRIVLDRGEAWFDVAKDKERPFVVLAGDTRVRAIGTAFSVRHEQQNATVMVTEGVVEAWQAGDTARRRLAAGSGAVFGPDRAVKKVNQALPRIERSLAWREGRIELDGDTLGAAAAEFNRYNSRKIVIDDAALAGERFVGLFQTNDPDGFTAAVAASLDARVVESDGEIHLRRA